MKLLIIAAVVGTALLSVVCGQSCANMPYSTFIPDGKQCNYYVSCVNKLATPLTCPSGYHFNARQQICDYPSKAGCVVCPKETVVNMRVDGSCKRFVQCFLGVGTDRECPAGLLFDATYGQCNVQHKVKCQ